MIKKLSFVIITALLAAVFCVCASAEEKPEFAESDYYCDIVGDANYDGKITVDDARTLLRIAVKLEDASLFDMRRCCVTGGKTVSVDDARVVLRIAVKLDDTPRHNKDKVVEIEPATCRGDGVSAAYCSKCGKYYDRGVIPSSGHVEGGWKTEVNATCTEEGIRTKSCVYCGTVLKTEVTKKKDHSWGEPHYENGEDRDCEKTQNYVRVCTECGALSENQVIFPTEHLFRWVTAKKPSCTEDGLEEYRCENCSKLKDTRVLPNFGGHKPSETYYVFPATCTEKGEKYKLCTVCNFKTESIVLEPLGHEEKEGSAHIVIAPTCTEIGTEEYICTRCGRRERAVDKLPHELTAVDDKYVAPTCTKNGLRVEYCSGCENEFETVIPATGHQNVSLLGKENLPEDAKEGYYYWKCDDCGAIIETDSILG